MVKGENNRLLNTRIYVNNVQTFSHYITLKQNVSILKANQPESFQKSNLLLVLKNIK